MMMNPQRSADSQSAQSANLLWTAWQPRGRSPHWSTTSVCPFGHAQLAFSVGRAGLEPATNGLEIGNSRNYPSHLNHVELQL